MKILAFISLKSGTPMEQVRPELPAEVAASWQMFAGGELREAYLTDSPTRVAFILEATGSVEARALLQKLPLVAKGLFEVQLTELRPFTNWARLPPGS